jgi:hypothetical protein
MAISSMDTLVAAMTASTAQVLTWNKTNISTEGAGTFHDLAQVAGFPGAMLTPDDAGSGGSSLTSASTGALPFTAPSGGSTLYLLNFSATSTQPGSIYMTDRLWACRGLATGSGATTTVTGMSNITRYDGGVGAEIWYWCISAPSAGGSGSMTVSYTNTAGVSGRTATITLGAGSPPPSTGQCYPASLQAGDLGVRSIQSVTNSATSFTGGTHGLVVAKRIVTAPISTSSVGTSMDGLRTGMQQIDSNACLNFVLLCTASTSGFWVGSIQLVEG